MTFLFSSNSTLPLLLVPSIASFFQLFSAGFPSNFVRRGICHRFFCFLLLLLLFLFTTNQIELKPVDPMNPEARWGSIKEVYNLLTHQKDKDYFLSISNQWQDI